MAEGRGPPGAGAHDTVQEKDRERRGLHQDDQSPGRKGTLSLMVSAQVRFEQKYNLSSLRNNLIWWQEA